MSSVDYEQDRQHILKDAEFMTRILRGEGPLGRQHPGLTTNLEDYEGTPAICTLIPNTRVFGSNEDMNGAHFSITGQHPQLAAFVRMAGIHPGALTGIKVVTTLTDDHVVVDIKPHIDPAATSNQESAASILDPGYIRGFLRVAPFLGNGAEYFLTINAFNEQGFSIVGGDQHPLASVVREYGRSGDITGDFTPFQIPRPAILFNALCVVTLSQDLPKVQPLQREMVRPWPQLDN